MHVSPMSRRRYRVDSTMAIAPGFPGDAAEHAIQADIVSVGYH